jgi:chromosome segregation ATPase
MVRRQVSRGRLIFDRRKLARLETALGLLGWQQADYDDGTQEHVGRLTNYEREQARLTNESAALGLEIQQIEEQRGVAQREFAEAEAVALEKEQPGVANVDALEALLVAKRKNRKELEVRLPALDRELKNAEEQYRDLVVPEMPSPQMQAQLLQLRKVILAIPQEKAEWGAKLQYVTEEIAALETLLGALREARAQFEKREEEWGGEINTRLRAKRKVEKQIDALEKAKTDPYREIGRALADHDIAPLNQPEALDVVLAQREKIAAREAAIAASLAESASEGRSSVVQAWLLVGGLIGLGTAGCLAIATP